jgi:very-short-patch-repair endonuclease
MSDMIGFARMLRGRPTLAEAALWRRIRRRQIAGVRFRRQAPVGPYIVDFASFDAGIVIELDGGQHALCPQRGHDEIRDRWLSKQGLIVLRFWNNDVLSNMDGVLSVIMATARPRSTS